MSFGSKHSSPRSRFDDMREDAFTKSHRHPLELQFGRERRPSGVLPVIAGGIVAAIGVTVVAALVFFNVVPTLKSDPSLAVSISKPASSAAAHAAPEDPQALLRKFVEFKSHKETTTRDVLAPRFPPLESPKRPKARMLCSRNSSNGSRGGAPRRGIDPADCRLSQSQRL